jgi:very-short-patch-repair endonuclease
MRSRISPPRPSHRASTHMIERARSLRSGATEDERLLWYRIRLWRDKGFNFRRQSPFRGYVLDFVCHKNRIVIELDGSQHTLADQERRDRIRDARLRREGYTTIRIPTWWVADDPDHVADMIYKHLSGVSDALPAMALSITHEGPYK